MSGKAFDIGDGIFWFFKRFGQNPAGALWIVLWQAVLGTAIASLMFYLLLPALSGFSETVMAVESGTMSDEEAGLLLLGGMLQMFAATSWGTLLVWIAALMFQGAWMRFLTGRPMAAVIPFRLGGDELRLLGVNLLYMAVTAIMYFGIVFALVTLGVTGGGIIAASGDNTAAGAVGFGFAMFFGILALFASVIFIAVKLSCAPALSVHDGKFRFFESWEATNGVFWNMLLSYFVVLLIAMAASMILGTIVQLVFLGAMLPMIQEFVALSESGVEPTLDQVIEIFRSTFVQPGVMVSLGIGVLLSYALQIVYEGMWHGVAAYNVTRYRDGSTVDEGDAPVMGSDSPLGASPSEG